MPRTFDKGNVYEKKGRLFLAVGKNKLLTCDDDGEFTEVVTDKKHSSSGEISVSDLCDIWDISISHLDIHVRKYFAPDAAAIAKSKKKRGEIEQISIVFCDD